MTKPWILWEIGKNNVYSILSANIFKQIFMLINLRNYYLYSTLNTVPYLKILFNELSFKKLTPI